jgi:hypothetical protein
VRLGLISQDWPGKLPEHVRGRLAASVRVDDARDAGQICEAVRELSSGGAGRPEMLVGAGDDLLLLPLAEVRDALRIRGMGADVARNFSDKARMRQVLRAAGIPVVRHARDAAALADAQPRTLEVMSVGGVPAWFSATRRDLTPRDLSEETGVQWSVVLPREVDDPADAAVRRLGFAALRALGMDSGITTMKWFRRPDGSAVVSDIAARAPGAQIVSLMGHAHGADMHRAYANALVNGLFAPVPRQFAAGAAFLRAQGGGERVTAVRGLTRLRRELGAMVVEVRAPRAGQPRSSSPEGEGFVLVRHPETAVVEEALRRLVSEVHVEAAARSARRARRGQRGAGARYSETW